MAERGEGVEVREWDEEGEERERGGGGGWRGEEMSIMSLKLNWMRNQRMGVWGGSGSGRIL